MCITYRANPAFESLQPSLSVSGQACTEIVTSEQHRSLRLTSFCRGFCYVQQLRTFPKMRSLMRRCIWQLADSCISPAADTQKRLLCWFVVNQRPSVTVAGLGSIVSRCLRISEYLSCCQYRYLWVGTHPPRSWSCTYQHLQWLSLRHRCSSCKQWAFRFVRAESSMQLSCY